jgi:hypothetical protein
MTTEEDRDLIDQVDIDTQVVAELSRSDGQGSSARLRVRRCGTCGIIGHNARICQEVLRHLERSIVIKPIDLIVCYVFIVTYLREVKVFVTLTCM